MSRILISLLGLSVILILAGASLLFGSPFTVSVIPTARTASVAYNSELVIAYDASTSSRDVLAIVGGGLTVGGLMLSAAAYGLRRGRASHAQ